MTRACFCLVLISVSVLVAQEPIDLAIEVALVVPVEGVPVEKASVLVREGRIVGIVKTADAPKAARKETFDGGVAFPGLIDGGSMSGMVGASSESARAFVPEIRAIDSIHRADRAFQAALATGVTTMQVWPTRANALGGRSARLRLDARGGATEFLGGERDCVSLDEGSYARGRDPTSAAGAFDRVRAALAVGAEAEEVKPADFMVAFSTPREREMAEELSAVLKSAGVWTAPPAAFEGTPKLGQAKGIILRGCVPALSLQDRGRVIRLAKSGLPVAFASEAPERAVAGLRMSAAVFATLVGEMAAERALTLNAAAILNCEAEVGSLTPGKRADVTVWTHRPSDPRARLLAVYVDGVRAELKESSQ